MKPTLEVLKQRIKILEEELRLKKVSEEPHKEVGNRDKSLLRHADEVYLKRIERKLKESEERHRVVLEANPDPLVMYDRVGKVIYFNPAFTHAFGWTLEERIGKKMDDFVPDNAWPETRIMVDKVRVGENFSGFETVRLTKTGNLIPVRISVAIHRDQEENIHSTVVNLRDISHREQLENQLYQTHKMETISNLAGGIAHEFNNALTGLVGNIQLLEMFGSEDDTILKHTESMTASTQRMTQLTSQLLAYARGGKYQTESVSLTEFVEESLSMIRPNIDLFIQINSHLAPDTKQVEIDPSQMQMVISAIINNAVEAIEGEGHIWITTQNRKFGKDAVRKYRGLKPGLYACMRIQDDGKGMDPETLIRIFDPFFSTKFLGRGLGMAAVYGIVKNHNGFIYVDTQLNQGTTIRIFLPVIEDGVAFQNHSTPAGLPDKGKAFVEIDNGKTASNGTKKEDHASDNRF